MAFARWWKDRLREYCCDDIPRGMFTDQRWMDLAPAYFDEVVILREPVFNVATWNLSRRKVEGEFARGLTIDGKQIVFYHFSGLDSGAQFYMLNRYGASMRGLYELRSWYLSECDRMGQQEFSRIPWAYGTFDNGEPIQPLHRQRYRERAELRAAFPNPFATTDVNQSYYHWFRANRGNFARILLPGRRNEGHWWKRLYARARS